MNEFVMIPQCLLSSIPPLILGIVAVAFFAFVLVCAVQHIWGFVFRKGTWYCDDLEMQISFNDPDQTFIIYNGEKIRCRCDKEYFKGTGQYRLYCQEREYPNVIFGEKLFTGYVCKYSKMSMVLEDQKTLQKYTFVRTDKTV